MDFMYYIIHIVIYVLHKIRYIMICKDHILIEPLKVYSYTWMQLYIAFWQITFCGSIFLTRQLDSGIFHNNHAQ